MVVELHAAATSEAISRSYVRRTPEHGVLHRLVREHLQTFLCELDRHDEQRGAPLFVKREFQRFVRCGVLAHGFARFRCMGCGTDRLVAFSCKGRGFCPSCGGRRMTERAAHLVDHVLPRAPVRQWVLSLPFELRYRMAWDHALCRTVLAVYTRALLGFYRKRAMASGHLGGFDLHANTSVRAKNRPKLERLCRYLLRPPVAEDRLSLAPDGSVLVRLKTPWRDGTSHIALQPLELLEKLAALIPRPYVNLIVYHGVLAPNARWRGEVVRFGRAKLQREPSTSTPRKVAASYNRTWAELMRRGLDIDVLECPD